MLKHKNRNNKTLILSSGVLSLAISLFAFLNFVLTPLASAANNGASYCSTIVSQQAGGGTPSQVQNSSNPAYKFYKACTDAYTPVYNAYFKATSNAQTTWNTSCNNGSGSPKYPDERYSFCTQGRNQAKIDGQHDRDASNGGNTSDNDIINKAKQANECQAGSTAIKNACIAGYYTGYKGGDKGNICKNGGSVTVGGTKYAVTTSTVGNCNSGFTAGSGEHTTAHPQTPPNPASGASAAAKDACKDYAPGGSKHNNTYYDACLKGAKDGEDGKTRDEACIDKYNAGDSRDACLVGYNATSKDEGDDTSACVANSHTSLEWIACPLIVALSNGTRELNRFVENQLNFDTKDFLPDSGSNAGAYKAWSIIKDLSTTVLIIILLIMVYSQAIGGGIFEAYTVRKILPRVVIAVIAMQLSWEICKFIIDLVNHLGEGLAQLITAPFGGVNNLDLGSLLHNLGSGWALGTSITLTAALVSTVFLGTIFAPVVLLIGFSLLLTVLVALATLLFRNIIIIACVIFSPIALLMWVIPSQSMKKYWNLWSDNFTKVLLLFPIMVAIIYSGRIFAYIAGGAANVGIMNLIMILVGFFAPYAILPKAFQWGGSWMKSGANLIATNWAVKRGGELGRKELREHMERKQGEAASTYNPDGPMFGVKRGKVFGKRTPFRVPTGKLATRIQAGSFMPTARGRNLAIKKGSEWKSARNEEAEVYAKRRGEVAMSEGYRKKDGEMLRGVKAQKQAILDLASISPEEWKVAPDAQKRAAQAAVRWLATTSSAYEVQNSEFESGSLKGKRIFDSPAFEPALMTDPGTYGTYTKWRPDVAPHVRQGTYGNTEADARRRFAQYGTPKPVQDEVLAEMKRTGEPARLRPADRMILTFKEYMDTDNYDSVAQGLWQEAAQLGADDMKIQIDTMKSSGASDAAIQKAIKDGVIKNRVADQIKADLSVLAQQGIEGERILGRLSVGSKGHDVDKAVGGNGDLKVIDSIKGANAEGSATAAANAPQPGGQQQPLATAPQTAPAAAAPAAPQPAATTQTNAGAGTPDTANQPTTATYTGPGKIEMREAFKEAIEETGLAGGGGNKFEAKLIAPQAAATEAPKETYVQVPSGTLVIPHKPGENVTEGGVILPNHMEDPRNQQ